MAVIDTEGAVTSAMSLDMTDDPKASLKPLRELAGEYGVSYRTIERWVLRHDLPRYTIPGQGRRIYVDPAALQEAMRPQLHNGDR